MSIMDKPTGPCRRCDKRPATHWWSDEGMIAAVHGMYSARCEHCIVEVQLEHAKEMAASIPKLEARLKELNNG